MDKLAQIAVVGEGASMKDLRTPMDGIAEELKLELVFRPAKQAAESAEPVIICLSAHGERIAAEISGKVSQPVLNVPVAVDGQDPLEVLRDQVASSGTAATLALGLAGAKNAVLAAAAIIGLQNPQVRKELDSFRERQTESVLAAELPGG